MNVNQKYIIHPISVSRKLSKAGGVNPNPLRKGVLHIWLLLITLLAGCFSSHLMAQASLPLPTPPGTPGQEVPQGPKPAPVELGKNDTILSGAILYQGDTIPYKELADIYIFSGTPEQYARLMERWTRLRNAVYLTYPYAVAAGKVINDINAHLAYMTDEKERKNYIKSREKELKAQFGNKLEEMSIYQGKILMKLINRQTGNNCYEIIKEYKGGFNARLWQTVAFFFGSNLKQPYDPAGEDKPIETIVQEIQRMYTKR